MKKILPILIVLFLAFGFTSCVSTQEVVPTEDVEKSNSKLDNLPEWILSTPKSADMFYAVGTAQGSNLQVAIKRAEAEGRNVISEWIQVNVKEVITTYVNDAGSGDNRQTIDAFEAISVQVSENSLRGVGREKFYQADDGIVYVLMSIPLSNVEESFEPASQAVANNFATNEAADEANKKMADAFEKLLKGDM